MKSDPLPTQNNETYEMVHHQFESIVQEGNLQVFRNAEFMGIHRAALSREQARKLFLELGISEAEIEQRASYEEVVVIEGEPQAEINPHIHERTPTFVVGIDGEAEVLVSDENKILKKGILIDFPMGEIHGLTMSKNGCVFIACSQNKVVDEAGAVDIKFTKTD